MARLFKTAFAYQGTKEQLPNSAQPDGKASFAEGFTADYTLDYGDADARDIAQSELNGIFHDITEALGELQQYGVAAWQVGMSPIAKYSLVFHDGKLWQAKKNTSATPAGGADWQQVDIADIASQLTSIDLSNYATKTYADGLVAGLASKSYVDAGLATKATASVVNAQLASKFNKTDVVQGTGQSTVKVMSQKAVTDAISGAATGQMSWGGITGDIENQADLKAALDAKLTKTFTPWQPEVIEGTGIDLPNEMIDFFGSSDTITLTGSTVRMERTGFPSALDAYLANGLKSDSFSFGDTTSLYYKVKSSLDAEVVGAFTYIGFANSTFDSWASAIAYISGGTLSLDGIGEMFGGVDNTEFNPPIEVVVTDDSEYCVSYDKTLNKVSFFVDGVEIASHAFATDFGFDVVTGSVNNVVAENYQGDLSTLTLWGETEFLSDPAHPIAGLEPLIIGASSTIDETKYPESPEGKGYEIVGLAQPAQWDALGKEVKNGDFIVFDNAGLPKEIGGGEVDLSEYTKRTADETIAGDWDFQGAMKVGDYTYNTMFGPYHVEKIITYTHPSLSSPMNIAYGIDAGYSFAAMAVAFNIDDLGLGEFITTELFTEEGSIAGGYTTVYSTTSKENDGTVEKRMVIAAYADGGVGTSIFVASRSDGVSYIGLGTGTEPVHGMYAGNILTESDGITIKAALDNKVDKIQVKEIVTANKTLTAADSGKLLIINADGITITLPASSDFNIDIAKMDEDFITIVECVGTDNFREGTATISVIRDVSITNSGVSGKEWLAIGAYEA